MDGCIAPLNSILRIKIRGTRRVDRVHVRIHVRVCVAAFAYRRTERASGVLTHLTVASESQSQSPDGSRLSFDALRSAEAVIARLAAEFARTRRTDRIFVVGVVSRARIRTDRRPVSSLRRWDRSSRSPGQSTLCSESAWSA